MKPRPWAGEMLVAAMVASTVARAGSAKGGCASGARVPNPTLETAQPAASTLAENGTLCWVPGQPPHFKHGRFRSRDLMRHYPLSSRFFDGLEPPPSFDTLLPVLHKLAAGDHVEIVLIGGSMPLGALCAQKLAYFAGGIVVQHRECSWGARFVEWVRSTFPTAHVDFYNRAQGGMPISFFATDVSRFVGPSTDLLIIDSWVNDYAVAPGFVVPPSGRATTDIAAALECVMMDVRALSPNTAVLDALLMPRWRPMFGLSRFDTTVGAHEAVMRHYRAAVYNLTGIVADNEAMWPTPPLVKHTTAWSFDSLLRLGSPEWPDSKALSSGMGGDEAATEDRPKAPPFVNVVHPHWSIHQLIADVLSNLVAKTLMRGGHRQATKSHRATSGRNASGPPLPVRPLNSPDTLEAFRGCRSPLTRWSAAERLSLHRSSGNASAPASARHSAPPQHTGDWKLYEDVKGKPGWIATETGSEIFFPVRVGAEPKVALTYLTTYTDMGNVAVYVNSSANPVDGSGRFSPLKRLYGKTKGAQFSQGTTVTLNTRLNARFRSAVEPHSDIVLRLHAAGGKFKLIEILSC